MPYATTSHLSVGDIGTELRARVGKSLANVDHVAFLVSSPHLGTREIAAEVLDSNIGIISYRIKDGDLARSGIYPIQAKIVYKDGSTYHGNTHNMLVKDLLK